MPVAVPFGQYVPGHSAVHTLDARMKLLLVVAFVFALFMVSGWLGLLTCVALLVTAYLIAGVPLKRAARGFKPVLLILAFTFFANALTFSAVPFDPATASDIPQSIALIGSFGVRPFGALQGLYFVLRIAALVSITSLLTFTSSVVSLADAITKLLAPLRLLRVPVEDIATMFSIALRFIPLTAEEAEKIMVAQSARGVRFDQGGPLKRARAWVPVMIPLFVNLFRRADELAAAMESRCYVGKGRTHLKVVVLQARDLVTGCVGTALLIVIGVLL
ncbi:MAG: energy-coupling factor transporter transmembrane protein EcfT [Coriobacteriales bacterium]|jgi:energy-coupling factor transport system permease protein|nr:energy-coupling factor transporter transmembrane protein EcfT [Coriobacteriales bacterium]